MIDGRSRVASTTELGRWNAETVLGALYDREPSTAAEVARETGLSRSTVEKALDLLVEHGVAGKSDPVALASGRPAALYRLRADFGHLLAIDVGAHTVRVRVDDLAGPGWDQARVGGTGHEPEPMAVGPEDPAERRLAVLDRLADRALARAGISPERVRAVTVGTPGIVDRAGMIVACRVIRGDWVGDRLRDRMSERFPGAAVAVENDANLAALAERRFGGIGDAREIVAVVAGRRIAFGVLRDGNVHRGAHNQVGEVANIRRSWWGRANDWLRDHDADAGRVFGSARAGHPDAMDAVGTLARALGMACAEIVHTIDPELIILGGAIAAAGPTVLDPVLDQFKRACQVTSRPPLRLSTLGRRAVLLGAAEHARRQAFTHVLDTARPYVSHPRRVVQPDLE